MTSFREGAAAISPPQFLGRGLGERLVYLLTLPMDGVMQWAWEGIKARFPEEAPPDALGPIGRDRRIVRGRDESDESYIARLLIWLDSWRAAGNAWSVLDQVAGYFAPTPPRLRIVTNSGMWFTRESDGARSWLIASPNNFDWDGDTASWSRFWLVIYADPLTDGGEWGDNVREWGDGGTIGTSATPGDVAIIRQIVQTWKGAHSRCEWIIVALDPESFDPEAAAGAPGMPDGTWGTWAIADPSTGIYEPTRLTTARYWEGRLDR